MTFRQRLAAQAGCDDESVVAHALLECVIPWKRPLYRIGRTLAPGAFEHDRDAVVDALNARSIAEVKQTVEMLHYRSRRTPSFWRDLFGLRVSGRRLMRLAGRVFRDSGGG
jgi:hypothetical protein